MPERPPPRITTFDFEGLPFSSGFCPAEPAIKSHEVMVLKTREDPPTAPSCSRNRRRVSAGTELRLLMDIRLQRNAFENVSVFHRFGMSYSVSGTESDDFPVEQLYAPLDLLLPARIVGDDADGGPGLVELVEHLHQRFAGLRIEIAGRLVGQKDRRTSRDRAGDGNELLMPA